MERSAYVVLGVSTNASPEEIRRAYRVMAKRNHPDRNGSTEEAHTRFVEIQLAYEILSDPDRRLRHDRGEEHLDDDRARQILEQRIAQLVRRRERLRRLYE